MSGKLISVIYFYLVSVISLILLIIGVFHIISFTLNTTQFDKYPLTYGEDRCLQPLPAIDSKQSEGDASLSAKQKFDCLAQLEVERKQHRVNDLKNAITFPLLGLILFFIHFPIALKRSKN